MFYSLLIDQPSYVASEPLNSCWYNCEKQKLRRLLFSLAAYRSVAEHCTSAASSRSHIDSVGNFSILIMNHCFWCRWNWWLIVLQWLI